MIAQPPSSAPRHGLRIATYSQDGFGMGHLRRTNSIAGELLKAHPDAHVLSICDSPSDQYFQPSGNYDRLKLPTIVKRGPGDWTAPRLGVDFDSVHRLRRSVLSAALVEFDPHLVLVDHMPHGSMGELLPALDALKQHSPTARVVLGLRDIVDAPRVVRHRWAVEGAFDALARWYDQVLIFGSPEVYDAAQLYGFSNDLLARTTYCGYVVSPVERPAAAIEAARRTMLRDAPPETELVVVMGGSGNDAAPMMTNALEAHALLSLERPLLTVVVCGPNMPTVEKRRLATAARACGAKVVSAVSDPASFIAAADAVVAMAGYNSTTEIVACGTPAVLVPRRGQSLEQRTRARLFERHGWVRVVDPDELTPMTLAAALAASLDSSPRPPGASRPDLAGLQSATQILSGLLADSASSSSGPPDQALAEFDGTLDLRPPLVAVGPRLGSETEHSLAADLETGERTLESEPRR